MAGTAGGNSASSPADTITRSALSASSKRCLTLMVKPFDVGTGSAVSEATTKS